MTGLVSPMTGRPRLWPLAAVLLLFLALQLPPILRVSIAQYDESIFLDIGRNIHATGLPLRSLGPEGQLELDQTPLYLYLLSGLMLLFGENLFALRLVTLLAAAACIALVYLITAGARGEPAAVVAGLLLAVNPFFNLYSFFLRMEAFACLFVLLAVYWLADDGRRPARNSTAAAAGLAMATAVLFKVTTITIWLAALPWALWQLWRDPARRSKLLWLALPTVIAVAGWLLAALLDPSRAASAGRWGAALGLGGNPVDARLGVAAGNWLLTIGRMVLGWPTVALLAMALVAYFARWRRQHPVAHLLALYIALTVGLTLVVQLKEARHVIGIIPAAAVLIGIALPWELLWRRVAERRATAALAVLAALALLWALSPLRLPARGEEWHAAEMWWEPLVRGRYFHNDGQLASLRDAGLYLRENTAADEFILIARQGPIVGNYAQRNYTFLYTGEFERNMDLLREATYLVMDPPVDYWAQTPEETAALLQFVAENFSVERVFESGETAVTLYRRNETAAP